MHILTWRWPIFQGCSLDGCTCALERSSSVCRTDKWRRRRRMRNWVDGAFDLRDQVTVLGMRLLNLPTPPPPPSPSRSASHFFAHIHRSPQFFSTRLTEQLIRFPLTFDISLVVVLFGYLYSYVGILYFFDCTKGVLEIQAFCSGRECSYYYWFFFCVWFFILDILMNANLKRKSQYINNTESEPW